MLWLQYLRAATARQPAVTRPSSGDSLAHVVLLLLLLFLPTSPFFCPFHPFESKCASVLSFLPQHSTACTPVITHKPFCAATVPTGPAQSARTRTHARRAPTQPHIHGPRFAIWKHRTNKNTMSNKCQYGYSLYLWCQNAIDKQTKKKKDSCLLRTLEAKNKDRNKMPSCN